MTPQIGSEKRDINPDPDQVGVGKIDVPPHLQVNVEQAPAATKEIPISFIEYLKIASAPQKFERPEPREFDLIEEMHINSIRLFMNRKFPTSAEPHTF